MNELYFTPKMDEIRIGVECELPKDSPDNFVSYTLTHEDISKIFSTYSNIRIKFKYLTEKQIEDEGWLKKGNIFYKSLWSLSILPNNRLIIKFGDEKRFHGKCKDLNTLRWICRLLEID